MKRMTPDFTTPPTLADIEAMAEATIAALPDAFRASARAVVLRITDFADEAMLASVDLEDPFGGRTFAMTPPPSNLAARMDRNELPHLLTIFDAIKRGEPPAEPDRMISVKVAADV